MAHYKADIHSSVPVEAAFATLSRFDHAADWDPGVTRAAMLTIEPVGLGSRFRLVARFLGRSVPLVYEIIEFAPPDRLVVQAENATIRSTDTITFHTDALGHGGGGTIVHYDAVLRAKGIGRFADPLLAIAFRRIGDRATAGLRAHLSAVPST
jgi:hypothetical protein